MFHVFNKKKTTNSHEIVLSENCGALILILECQTLKSESELNMGTKLTGSQSLKSS